MLKKLISSILALAILAFVPVMIAGCEEPNEYKRTTSYEQKDKPVKPQKEVVE